MWIIFVADTLAEYGTLSSGILIVGKVVEIFIIIFIILVFFNTVDILVIIKTIYLQMAAFGLFLTMS